MKRGRIKMKEINKPNEKLESLVAILAIASIVLLLVLSSCSVIYIKNSSDIIIEQNTQLSSDDDINLKGRTILKDSIR